MQMGQGAVPADKRQLHKEERGGGNATRDDVLGAGMGRTRGEWQAKVEGDVVNDGDGNRGGSSGDSHSGVAVAGNSRGRQQSTKKGG
jgi:hypothetical protein